MGQGSRPDRVAEQIRQELSTMLLREVQDPGIGLVTVTRVKVSPDLQVVRIFYTILGDDKAKKETARGLQRATPFLRRLIGERINMRRVPELNFQYDEGMVNADRVERILAELQREREEREGPRAEGQGPREDTEEGPRAKAQGPREDTE